MAIVYWIHSESHTDPDTEGYIGVTKVSLEKRISNHISTPTSPLMESVFKKHKTFKVSVLHEFSEEICYALEEEYRPHENIGWNIAKGGEVSASMLGKSQSEKQKQIASETHKGKEVSEETRKKISKAMKGKPATKSKQFECGCGKLVYTRGKGRHSLTCDMMKED